MDVRLGDVRYTQPFCVGGIYILPDVAIRIDDQRLAGGLAPNEIARLRELVVIEAFQQHAFAP